MKLLQKKKLVLCRLHSFPDLATVLCLAHAYVVLNLRRMSNLMESMHDHLVFSTKNQFHVLASAILTR